LLCFGSKHEDSISINLQSISDIINEKGTDQKKMIQIEEQTLNYLNWDLFDPTIYSLANEYLQMIDLENEIVGCFQEPKHIFSELISETVNYLLHLSHYYSFYFRKFDKKQIAASSVYLSLLSFGLVEKFPASILNSFNTAHFSPILESANLLLELFKCYLSSFATSNYTTHSIYKKFSMQKFKKISLILLPIDKIPN
jgi:hypothetical protein